MIFFFAKAGEYILSLWTRGRGEFDRRDARRAVGERFMSMRIVDEQALTSYSTGAMNCVYEVTHFREAIRGA